MALATSVALLMNIAATGHAQPVVRTPMTRFAKAIVARYPEILSIVELVAALAQDLFSVGEHDWLLQQPYYL